MRGDAAEHGGFGDRLVARAGRLGRPRAGDQPQRIRPGVVEGERRARQRRTDQARQLGRVLRALAGVDGAADDQRGPTRAARSCRTARGRACPLNTASAAATAAATTTVSAAARITKRCAFIRGSVSEPRAKPIRTGAYDPD